MLLAALLEIALVIARAGTGEQPGAHRVPFARVCAP